VVDNEKAKGIIFQFMYDAFRPMTITDIYDVSLRARKLFVVALLLLVLCMLLVRYSILTCARFVSM